MTNTIKSVIALGMKDQFHIPKPFGDQHRLTEGVTPLFITPGYRGVDHDNKIQFPHGLLLRLDRVGKVEDILAQYVPAGPKRPRRVDDIQSRSRAVSIEAGYITIPEPLASAMRVRSTRVTAILIPSGGIDLQFTSKHRAGNYPNIWMVMNG